MAKHEAGYERLGAKVLSLPDVIAQSVGFMGPVFSSAFVIPLVVGVVSASGKGGGVASPISVLIAAVGVFAIGAIVSRYAKEVHAAVRPAGGGQARAGAVSMGVLAPLQHRYSAGGQPEGCPSCPTRSQSRMIPPGTTTACSAPGR